MKRPLSAIVLCAIYLVFLPSSPAQTAHARTVWIELPEMGASFSHLEESSTTILPESGALTRIQSVAIHLNRQPDEISGSSLGIRINAEAGNIVMTQRNTEDGIICDIPLRQNPTVALHPGATNTIEVFYRDRWNQPHYSVFLLLSPGAIFHPIPPTRDTAIQSSRHYALVVGISRYQRQGATLPGLPYAARDAKAVRDFLISPEGGNYPASNVKLLLDEDATNENLYQALHQFAKNIGAQDSLVIYFNLHGGYDQMDPGHQYLLTYESDPRSLKGSAIPVEELPAWLADHLLTKHIVLFTDLCHASKIGEGLPPHSNPPNLINQYLAKAAGRLDLTSIEASKPGSLSAAGSQWEEHGIFTYYLLKGLSGEADGALPQGKTGKRDGVVFTNEIGNYMLRVTAQQNPLLTLSGSGAFSLSKPGFSTSSAR